MRSGNRKSPTELRQPERSCLWTGRDRLVPIGLAASFLRCGFFLPCFSPDLPLFSPNLAPSTFDKFCRLQRSSVTRCAQVRSKTSVLVSSAPPPWSNVECGELDQIISRGGTLLRLGRPRAVVCPARALDRFAPAADEGAHIQTVHGCVLYRRVHRQLLLRQGSRFRPSGRPPL